jgi:aminoglycoside phosphotransferase (APT) family kinase protein
MDAQRPATQNDARLHAAEGLSGPPIARGRTAEIYAWQDGTVLKLFYEWCPPNWVQAEIATARVVSATELPTPRLLDTMELNGRHGVVFERVEGPSMLRALNARPWMVRTYARLLAELHNLVHQHSGAGFRPLRPSLRWTIENTDDLPADVRAIALDALERLQDGTALCHFDFHPDQVILTRRGPVILDWMTAHQGAPAGDLARTKLIMEIGQPSDASWLQRRLFATWRTIFLRSYLERYRELNPGLRTADIQAWLVPVAAARLREAIPGEREHLLKLVREAAPVARRAATAPGGAAQGVLP